MKTIEYENDELYQAVNELTAEEQVNLYNLASGNKVLLLDKDTVNSYFGSVFDFLNKVSCFDDFDTLNHKWFTFKDEDSSLEGFRDEDLIYLFDECVGEYFDDMYDWIENNKDIIRKELGLDFQNITKIEIPQKVVEQLINSIKEHLIVQHFYQHQKKINY